MDILLEKLLEVGAHFGHQNRRWNPKMSRYMYDIKGDIYVFDLVKTKKALEEALDVITKSAAKGEVILLVGTKKQAKDRVKEIALECGIPYVSERWLGGTFTNFDQLRISINRLVETKGKMEGGEYKDYTKKERLLIDRKMDKMDKTFGGIVDLDSLPDLMIVVDTHREHGAVKEAKSNGVPVIGIVDSNADPDMVDWPIPMNDDATSALEYVLDLIKEAILKGKKKSKK